jgi:hypothetical protein
MPSPAVTRRILIRSLKKPTTPTLAMDPGWLTTDNTPDFVINTDNTVVAGDNVRVQVQAAGGDWTTLVSDTNRAITSGEDATNTISFSLVATFTDGNYEARCSVTHGVTSDMSNVVSFTVATAINRTAVFITELQY